MTDARPIWKQSVGIPADSGAGGDSRTYSLLTNRFADHTSLYVRVEDERRNTVYATYSLGHVIAFDEPHAEIDRENKLHVLHCSAPRAWSYTIIGLNGQLLSHSTLLETKSRPHFKRTADWRNRSRGRYDGGDRRSSSAQCCPEIIDAPKREAARRLRYWHHDGMFDAIRYLLLRAMALASTVSAQTRYNTVVIDAGHGGFDRGGIPSQRVPEKMMTLDVALKLKPILEKAGYRVVMTRSTDVFVPLGTRVAIANSYPNAIFVCIHFNSASRSGANGIETYFYSTESAPLAASIHSAVVGGAPSENRGVRRRGYFVLRRTTVPAVLVECGFLTNPGEAQAALTNSYRQQLAQEIARGITNRPTLAARTTYTNQSSKVDVGLQPFLDQRFVRESKARRHRHNTSSKKKKSSSTEKKEVSSEAQ